MQRLTGMALLIGGIILLAIAKIWCPSLQVYAGFVVMLGGFLIMNDRRIKARRSNEVRTEENTDLR